MLDRIDPGVLKPLDPHVILVLARDQPHVHSAFDEIDNSADKLHVRGITLVLVAVHRMYVLGLHVETLLGVLDQLQNGFAVVIRRQQRLNFDRA